jgi:hypothetical protein
LNARSLEWLLYVGCGSSMFDVRWPSSLSQRGTENEKTGSAAARSVTMQECLHCHELFYPENEDIRVRLGQKDRPVDVTAYSRTATAFDDERDGQGGFATPAGRIETL